ncbi:MAG TPA: lysophospholipid acyltransferase family protein [Gemmatimonadales bacterium]|nr:lysophospholipid acyltransferase family protein [Gemmatimonadales bacterium]
MRRLRYLATLVGATAVQGTRVIVAAARGVRQTSGGVYDDAPRRWGRELLDALGIVPEVEGLDRLPPGQPCVYVSNHVSYADVWVLLAVVPGSVRFVAKKELLRIPLFAQALRQGGQIVIDRRHLKSAFGAYDAAAAAIRAGMSAIVFVEGTRSSDGALLPFKKGPFVLAIAAQVPVVPVYVEGTREVLPRGRLVARQHPVRVRFGAPIPTAGLGYEDRDALSARAREAMLALRR